MEQSNLIVDDIIDIAESITKEDAEEYLKSVIKDYADKYIT